MKNTEYISRPWTFKFEFTKGCNLKCYFCPVYAMPELQDPEQREYMTPQLMRGIARSCADLNPSPRVELTMRGEPTLNPHVLKNLVVLREEIPGAQISMFTNGVTLLRNEVSANALLDAGVNILNIDCYNKTYDRFEALARTWVAESEGETRLEDFRKFSAYKRHPKGERMRVVNLVPDIADENKLVAVRVIHNNAGNVDAKKLEERWGIPPLRETLKKKCARPFREFVVNWDGTVPICCHDWKDEAVLGKMPEQSASEIWFGDTHLAILRDLYAKDRSGAPCNKCDYAGGFRLGFLQNPNEERH